MSNRTKLREQGYSADDSGHIICHREGVRDRYAHERTAVIRIELEHDSREGRALLDRLLSHIDEPRALIGRSSDGSVVVLGRCETEVIPQIRRGSDRSRAGVFELLAGDGAGRFTITCASDGQTLDVDSYAWAAKRSPLDVPRDSLAMLFADIGESVVTGALKSATWAPTAAELERERATKERLEKIRQDIASGKLIVNPTPEQQQAMDDDKLVAAHEGIEYAPYDGNMASLVLAARSRVARRKVAAEAERLAALTPEERAEEIQAREDAATVDRHKDSIISASDGEYCARIIQARGRHAARQKAQAAAA